LNPETMKGIKIEPLCFVHCSDLHLDSPFAGLGETQPDIAELLKRATFAAFDRIVDLAVAERADFIIISGDIYDGADRSLLAQIRFHEGLSRAAEAGIKSFIAHGNHDPLSGWEAGLVFPPEVYRFGGDRVESYRVKRDGIDLASVSGISYSRSKVEENLALGFKADKKAPFNIGVLHSNLGGDPNHDNYAPCVIDDLISSGMDYWALGHIHNRAIKRENHPTVVYPGNPQGRSLRETGPRGCYLVRVDESGQVTLEFHETDSVRWLIEDIDISDRSTENDLIDRLLSRRDAVRAADHNLGKILTIRLTGRGALHKALQRPENIIDITEEMRSGESERKDFVWLDSIRVNTRPEIDIENRRRMDDFVGDFLKAAERLRRDENAAARLREFLMSQPGGARIKSQIENLPESDLYDIVNRAEIEGLNLLLPDEETGTGAP